MRYTRSRTQLVPMSSVVTEDFYYEQVRVSTHGATSPP